MDGSNCNEENKRFDFISNVIHDLRTPINSIVSFSRLLAQTDDQEEKTEYVDIVEENYALVMRLINDILDLSKTQNGQLSLEIADIDISNVLKDEYKFMLTQNRNRQVEMVLDPIPDKMMVQTDDKRVIQVINNLIGNAMKFTVEGSIHLGMDVDEHYIKIYIKDTGRGIAKKDQERIFDKFVELGSRANGFGLGLYLCKNFVRLLHGEIGLDSEENKGATFWFTIPIRYDEVIQASSEVVNDDKKTNDAQVANGGNAVQEEKETKKKEAKAIVLVAEDDKSNYHLVELLARKYFNLVHAWNGEEAIKLYEEYQPALILMDINMPKMNGYEAFTAIRKIDKNVPIVAVTAYALSNEKQQILDMGFNGYITKPIDINAFVPTISQYLE